MNSRVVDPIVSEFTQVNQELATVVRRRSSGQLIDPADLKKFAFELVNFHMFDADKIAANFKTNVDKGLTMNLAKRRLAENGPNMVDPPKDYPLWVKFFFSFISGFAPLLWIATALVFISWEPFGTPPSNLYNLILAIVLIIVIVVSGIFTFVQEMTASRILEGFKNLVPVTTTVVRDGVFLTLKASDLVVGDLVLLSAGNKVPSDLRIIEAEGLKIDKSMFTGESEPVKMTTGVITDDTVTMLSASNIGFMGTDIIEGQGKGIVIATGASNQLNKIIQGASGKTLQTSLQKDIDRLVLIIGSFALITGIVVVLFWAFWIRVRHSSFMSVSSMIANAISVVVAYVPEGLPLALSMGLTIIARRLCLSHNVLVKRLSTIETVGSMSFLGSDKTGTLTQNKMTVTNLVSAINLVSDAKDGQDGTLASRLTTLHFLARRVCTINNQASLQLADDDQKEAVNPNHKNEDEEAAGIQLQNVRVRMVAVGGNVTDQALLNWAAQAQDDVDLFLHNYFVLCRIPFSSTTKMSAVVVKDLKTNERYILVKGAPEYVLAHCTSYLDEEMTQKNMTGDFNQKITKEMNIEASKGRRMVGLAQMGPLNSLEYPIQYEFHAEPKPNFPLNRLTFISAVAVSDPPKEGVKEAIEEIREAGIIVAMITGDAAPTAIAIAKEVGIVTYDSGVPDTLLNLRVPPEITTSKTVVVRDSGKIKEKDEGDAKEDDELISKKILDAVRSTAIAVTGPELDTVTNEDWDFIFQHKEFIFARTTPEHKLMIVKEAQRRGHRVGVTGDGINDSPALKNADVGIAMKNGAEVARDAAAIVLLDNNFSSIVHAVMEGRLIFTNLRRVIGYQISAGCWGELLPVLATFFLGLPQPLSSFLMILISCMTDVYAGIALMNEPPETDIMRQPPRDIRKSHLLDYRLVVYAYLFYANLNSVGAFYTYFLYMAERGNTRALPDPIPGDDASYNPSDLPAGYRLGQLIGAWNWGAASGPLSDDETQAANVGSSIFFVCIVVTQMGHLLSIRRKTPYFYDAIMNTKNEPDNVFRRIFNELIQSEVRWPIVCAWIGSIVTVNFFNYVPIFQQYCGTAAVPGRYWGIAVGWSILWFTVAEIRKWIIKLFPQSFLARHDW